MIKSKKVKKSKALPLYSMKAYGGGLEVQLHTFVNHQ